MIFCTVGTTDFDPLIEAVDVLAPALNEQVVFQIGGGTYEPRNGDWFRLRTSIDALINSASLVVAHGGFGTIVQVLSTGKPLICAPNPDRFDNHQTEIVRQFARYGYLIPCLELNRLAESIEKAKRYEFVPYRPPECWLDREVQRHFDAVAATLDGLRRD